MSKLHLGVPVSEYTPSALEWLIDYRFPLNRVVLLFGQEKSGKSQFNALLAACVTNNAIPFAPNVRVNESGNVVIFSTERTEDYFARVDVAGADNPKVRIVNAERGYDWDRVITEIESIPSNANMRLISIDHIGDLSEKEIRSIAKVGNIVNRLAAQAIRLRCCIVLVTHTIKNGSKATRFQQTCGGSVAWIRKVSDAWGMCLIKPGVGVIEHGVGTKKGLVSCWEYRMTDKVSEIVDDKGKPIESEYLAIEGDSPTSYLKAFNMSEDGAAGYVSKLDKAKELLTQTLADGGAVAAKEIFEVTAENDIGERTVWSAAKDLGIVTSGGPGSKWSLPKVTNSANSASDAPDDGLQSLQTSETCAYTDPKIMASLHEVLGPCALDPASPPVPVHVQALKWYALERGEDGLNLSWFIPDDGRSWLYGNTPWGAGKGEPSPLPEWAKKLLSEVACRNVPRSATLWPYSPDTDWYKSLKTIPGMQEIRITRKGLKFGNAKNGPSTNLKVLALLTVGLRPEEVAALRESLERHGVDVVPD